MAAAIQINSHALALQRAAQPRLRLECRGMYLEAIFPLRVFAPCGKPMSPCQYLWGQTAAKHDVSGRIAKLLENGSQLSHGLKENRLPSDADIHRPYRLQAMPPHSRSCAIRPPVFRQGREIFSLAQIKYGFEHFPGIHLHQWYGLAMRFLPQFQGRLFARFYENLNSRHQSV